MISSVPPTRVDQPLEARGRTATKDQRICHFLSTIPSLKLGTNLLRPRENVSVTSRTGTFKHQSHPIPSHSNQHCYHPHLHHHRDVAVYDSLVRRSWAAVRILPRVELCEVSLSDGAPHLDALSFGPRAAFRKRCKRRGVGLGKRGVVCVSI
jgi:hypothetical protein